MPNQNTNIQNIDLSTQSLEQLNNLLVASEAQIANFQTQATLVVANAKVSADGYITQANKISGNIILINNAIAALQNPVTPTP